MACDPVHVYMLDVCSIVKNVPIAVTYSEQLQQLGISIFNLIDLFQQSSSMIVELPLPIYVDNILEDTFWRIGKVSFERMTGAHQKTRNSIQGHQFYSLKSHAIHSKIFPLVVNWQIQLDLFNSASCCICWPQHLVNRVKLRCHLKRIRFSMSFLLLHPVMHVVLILVDRTKNSLQKTSCQPYEEMAIKPAIICNSCFEYTSRMLW